MALGLDLQVTYSEPQVTVFFSASERFVIVPKGRRLGITRGAAQAFIEHLVDGITPLLWGDTINGNIDRYMERYFMPILKQIPKEHWKWNQQKRTLQVFDSVCDFRSADRPENWEGFGYRKIFLNEAGIILNDPYLYRNAVLPMLMDFSDSQLIAAGVPKGTEGKDGQEHVFYQLYKQALEDTKGRFKLLQYTSYDTPFIHEDEIKLLEEEMGPAIASQEIYAQFVNISGTPFIEHFTHERHVSGEIQWQPSVTTYACFDFNIVNTCLIIQRHVDKIHVLQEYHQPGIDLEDLVNLIKKDYPSARFLINGDASGHSGSALTKGNASAYELLNTYFGWGRNYRFIRVPRSNPGHFNSRIHCNKIFKHNKILIHPRCKGLIRDVEQVKIEQKGESIAIIKSDPTLTHHLDPLRYHIFYEHQAELKRR